MRELGDSLLISKLKEGDKFAFELLYQKYSGRLYNSISLILCDKNLAKDILQSSFLIIWEKRKQLDPQKNFSAYLFTIARNLAYKETERLVLKNKYEELRSGETDEVEDHIIENLTDRYREDNINQLIVSLSPISKEIFQLKREENLPNKKIASQLGLTEKSVESHFYRTVKYLKEKLAQKQVKLSD